LLGPVLDILPASQPKIVEPVAVEFIIPVEAPLKITVSLIHSKDEGPVGPDAPDGPVTPVGPGAPDAPVTPVGPDAPVGPVAPVVPVGPVGPGAPDAPVTPVGPVGPVAPVGPVVPVGPVGPKNPVDQVHLSPSHIKALPVVALLRFPTSVPCNILALKIGSLLTNCEKTLEDDLLIANDVVIIYFII
jgi:hypothetical protein